MAPQCTALNLSDEKRCLAVATSANGLFCRFHLKQCHGLYIGYKKRNARLDALTVTPPTYLANNSTSLSNQTFADLDDQAVLKEVHDYLFQKYALLDRVIRARKLHHSRFFSLSLDYGHQHYLDNLANEKFIVLRALERVEHRTAEVLFKQKQWFSWVREMQSQEEEARDKESKKVKMEAALFKRHMKELETRTRELRVKEKAMQQDEFLEKTYQERTAAKEAEDWEDEEDDEGWDPIEDVIENERGNFVDLIRHFLWQDEPIHDDEKKPTDSGTPNEESLNGPADTPAPESTEEAQNASKSSKNKKKKAKKTTAAPPAPPAPKPDAKARMETKEEMQRRLREGSKLKHDCFGVSILLKGTHENPVESTDRTVSIPDSEIEGILKDVTEIKHLLLCRLLLSHATLLPVALRCDNVDEFLGDPGVSTSDLRDLCLKLERPELHDVRDACADFMRGDDVEPDVDEVSDDDEKPTARSILGLNRRRNENLPRFWTSKHEEKFRKHKERRARLKEGTEGGDTGTYIDFGNVDDAGDFKTRTIRVCGRTIGKFPSKKRMARGGWFHFSIIAKDSSLFDCIELCRSWEEFYELNILTCWGYFPAGEWISWVRDPLIRQLLLFGFIPYHQLSSAEELTKSMKGRQMGRRTHAILEVRNFVCAQVKRGDPVMRRFIQYLCMEARNVLVLLRDGKTGQILAQPPAEDLWIVRGKAGMGRARKKEYDILMGVGEGLFREMEEARKWHFSFPDYYDVIIWDYEVGAPFELLFNEIQRKLVKAYRLRESSEFYRPQAYILKTITSADSAFRVRDIRPGEEVQSLYDGVQDGTVCLRFHKHKKGMSTSGALEQAPRGYFYDESDALEDQVLFPDDAEEVCKDLFPQYTNAMQKFDMEGPSIERFVFDLDSDEEVPDPDSDQIRRLMERAGPKARLPPLHGEYFEDWDLDDDDESDNVADKNIDMDQPLSGQKREISKEEEMQKFEDMEEFEVSLQWCSKILEAKDKAKSKRSMDEDFLEFRERETAKMFRGCWHKADLEPGAQEKYIEMTDMINAITDFRFDLPKTTNSVHLALWMDINPTEHQRIIADMSHAYFSVIPFFPQSRAFFEHEKGAEFRDSVLLNQAERAESIPDRKRHDSSRYLPESYWTELDSLDTATQAYADVAPFEWSKVTRPIIAKLFREGIIGPAHSQDSYSRAIAGPATSNPDSRPDLFIDYRHLTDATVLGPEMEDPTTITTSSLRLRMTSFAQTHPNARFSLLRLWSAPHFWPLMCGRWRWSELEFKDTLGRTWFWKFIPKDMGYSEWSVHHQSRLRIERWKRLFGEQVKVKRDLFVVMASDEKECLNLSTAVTYAVQTKPWRLEMDFWRSFVNVDIDFVGTLDDRWMD